MCGFKHLGTLPSGNDVALGIFAPTTDTYRIFISTINGSYVIPVEIAAEAEIILPHSATDLDSNVQTLANDTRYQINQVSDSNDQNVPWSACPTCDAPRISADFDTNT